MRSLLLAIALASAPQALAAEPAAAPIADVQASAAGAWREEGAIWSFDADGAAHLSYDGRGPSNGRATWRQEGSSVIVLLHYRAIAVSWRYVGRISAAGDRVEGRAYRTEAGIEADHGPWTLRRP
ncbi:MAG: hypothetical protein AB7J28_04840 [Hyphomonadaceae bacterium]